MDGLDKNSRSNMNLRDQVARGAVRMPKEPEAIHRGGGLHTNETVTDDARQYYHDSYSTLKKVAHVQSGAAIGRQKCQFLDADAVARMQSWIDNIPNDCGSGDFGHTRDIDIEVLKEWMNWSKYSAFAWIQKLDKYERRYRIAALEYHKVPNSLRHSSTLLHGSKIDQGTLTRLKQILETDRPRSQQSFFITWLQIYNTAIKTMKEVDSYQPLPDDPIRLRAILHRFKFDLGRLEKPLRILEMGLDWLEAAIARVVSRSSNSGTEQLEERHSREGALFRQWIQTLPEIEQGLVKSSQYTEFYVEQLLEIGVEREAYWSMLVKGGRGGEAPLAS